MGAKFAGPVRWAVRNWGWDPGGESVFVGINGGGRLAENERVGPS